MVFGGIVATIVAAKIPHQFVDPTVWMRVMGLTSKRADPDGTRRRAIELWPGENYRFSAKSAHNRADAALIAAYGLTTTASLGGLTSPAKAATAAMQTETG